MRALLSILPVLFWASPLLAQDHSVYVPMKDGTRLAVDVYLPAERGSGETFPALLEQTRYWRSRENARTGEPVPALNGLDRFFLEHDYALLKVDVRGTGASFGSRQMEYGTREVLDGYDIVEWVVAQPWCSGSVGAYGTSYSGTTAEFLAAVKHPAVKAVIPGWSDFDLYRSPARPYGAYAKALIDTWGGFVAGLDANDAARAGGHVRRVDEDVDGSLRDAAVAEHVDNVDVAAAGSALDFRDDSWGGEDTYHHASSLYWKDAIEESGVPMLVFASWFDAGTAEGALLRYQHYSNPQKLVILASNHGGALQASPFSVSGSAVDPVPDQREQFELRLTFFDQYLKDGDMHVGEWPDVRYFNLGEEALREANEWPPAGTEKIRLYPEAEHALASEAPETGGRDEYEIDFVTNTGTTNRWSTQLGGPVWNLHDRGKMDARSLTYTSTPLEDDLQVTGTPTFHLQLSSTAEDGLVLVYLEDVAPDGQSRYITEGGLRLIHRRLALNPYLKGDAPYQSFEAADAVTMEPGEVDYVAFKLHPTSVRFQKGHRIRIAIAGTDATTFGRLPAEGTPTLTVSRGPLTYLELPVQSPAGH